ncbi:G2/mitotic-specific cyclin B [Cladochytrium replicatum]|nr:G2/mitotic-specific cyclin B [Cladochytrium replicatum]
MATEKYQVRNLDLTFAAIYIFQYQTRLRASKKPAAGKENIATNGPAPKQLRKPVQTKTGLNKENHAPGLGERTNLNKNSTVEAITAGGKAAAAKQRARSLASKENVPVEAPAPVQQQKPSLLRKPSAVGSIKEKAARAARTVKPKENAQDDKENSVPEPVTAPPAAPVAAPATKPRSSYRVSRKSKDPEHNDDAGKHSASSNVSAGSKHSQMEEDDAEERVIKKQKTDPMEEDEVEVEPEEQAVSTPAHSAEMWDDLDEEDLGDPMMVAEYVVEIFEYMRELEIQTLPNPTYIDNQQELSWKMRLVLIDWLIDVHNRFKLLPETLFLAVNIVDRFLSLRVVSMVKLQLVGVTAMFIASKYEETVAPSVNSFSYMAENGYTDEEILRAERYVLQVLDFGLHYPSPLNFLRRCSKADNYDIQTRTLAKYFMEIALVDHKLLDCPPSKNAAASLYLARKMLNRGSWNANLAHYSGYTEPEVEPVCKHVYEYLQAATPMSDALFRKYSSKKYMKASLFAQEWCANNDYE